MTGEPERGGGTAEAGPAVAPVLRAESADEVLDAAVPLDGDDGGPRLTAPRLAERHPRAARAISVLLLVAVAAALGGRWTRDADRHDAAAAARSKVVLRLLGGGGSVDLDPAGGPPDSGVAVRLTFPVRDDGPAAVGILDATLHDSGVDVLPSAGDANVAPAGRPVLTEVQPVAGNPLVVAPGKAVLVTVRANVDCLDRGLPARPGALSLTVRGADGRVGQVVLPDPRGTSPAVGDGDYYAVCGTSQTSITPQVVYNGLVSGADTTQRSFSYQETLSVQGEWAQRVVTPESAQPVVAGLSTTTDLAGPTVLAPGVGQAVVVTVHASDCGAIAEGLGFSAADGSSGGGSSGTSSGTSGGTSGGTSRRTSGIDEPAALGVDALFLGTTLEVTPGDPRFPQVPVAVDPPASPKFVADFLTQLRAACPGLD